MTVTDLFEFASTALVRHRVRAGLSLLGVVIGVAAVVLLTAIGEGARRLVEAQFAGIGSRVVFVIPGKTETTGGGYFPEGLSANELTIRDAQVLERLVRGARRLSPHVVGTESVSFRERRRRVPVLGSTHELRHIRQLEMAAGAFLPEMDFDRGASVAVLGDRLARELFPNPHAAVGQVVRVGDWRMRVAGVLRSKGQQLGMNIDDIAIIPVATAMRMFNRTSLWQIVIAGESHGGLDGICTDVLTHMAERHGEEDVTCLSEGAVLASLLDILTGLTLALGAIATVSLAVAGVGIMNLMLVSVSERTHEVGLLKAVGAPRSQVLTIFLAEAVLLGGTGGVVGVSVGWILVQLLVLTYPAFPASAPLWAILAALALSTAAGAVFGVLPARRAARLDPVLALVGG